MVAGPRNHLCYPSRFDRRGGLEFSDHRRPTAGNIDIGDPRPDAEESAGQDKAGLRNDVIGNAP
jgi:hypothetical protein